MALANYTDLQAAATSWSSRTYATGQVVDAITLGEARINADLEMDMTATKTSTAMVANNRELTYNPTTSVIRSIRYGVADGSEMIEAIAPEALHTVQTTSAGRPTHYVVRLDKLEWNCPPGAAYTIEIEAFGRLTIATSTTNWLLTYVPQIYLAAMMSELIGGPERNDAEWQKWEFQYKRALGNARSLLNRMMGRNEVRMAFDAPTTGGGYDINSDD